MSERTEMNEAMMEEVIGGKMMTVYGTKNFLALRNEKKYDDSNIIGKLYNGDKVDVKEKCGTYWLVKTKSGKLGYVNHNYLK